MAERRDRFPGYDVLAKRGGPSWNEQTRQAVDARLAIDPDRHEAFDEAGWRTLKAVCERIVPQPRGRARPVPLAAMVDRKAAANTPEGHRRADMPPLAEAWRRGLAALDGEARAGHGVSFHDLSPGAQDGVLRDVQAGRIASQAWGDMDPARFFASRVLGDILPAYYSHPTAWSEIGFGGPASPRGYVRLDVDRRDPWEAVEAEPGREAEARRINARVR